MKMLRSGTCSLSSSTTFRYILGRFDAATAPGNKSLLRSSWSSLTHSQYGSPYRRFLTTNDKSSSSSSSSLRSTLSSRWKQFIGPRQMPERWTGAWYREVALICTVFAITGSSTMILVRPAVSNGLGLKGSMREGPWSYRICSLVIMTPIYATLLVVVGTVFGRHFYFKVRSYLCTVCDGRNIKWIETVAMICAMIIHGS